MNIDYGKIIGIKGHIIEVEFTHNQPNVHDVLVLQSDPNTKMEVFASKDRLSFFCISLSNTDKMFRGMNVLSTKKPILIPVGEGVLGRVMNVFGQPLDGLGEIKRNEELPIYNDSENLNHFIY